MPVEPDPSFVIAPQQERYGLGTQTAQTELTKVNGGRHTMRKSLASLIALAVLGLAMPMATSSPADAKHYGGHKKVVVVKTHRDRGLHRGWYKGRHY